MGHVLFCDNNSLAASGVASHTRGLAVDGKTSKITNFYSAPTCERVCQGINNGSHRGLGILLGELIELCGKVSDEIGAIHDTGIGKKYLLRLRIP